MLGKVQILELQFHEARIDIVGVQEGRASATSVRSGLHYEMYVGAADADGQAGCQVWVARSLGFKLAQFIVVSPRLVYVTGHCKHDSRMVQVLCAHAPTELATLAAKDAFWHDCAEASSKLATVGPTALRFFAMDANARVSHQGCEHVGRAGTDSINDNGERFLLFLRDSKMVAVNTFWDCGHTWRSPHGPAARLDYVCVPAWLPAAVEVCDIPDGVDLSLTTKEDHRAVRVSMLLRPPAPKATDAQRSNDIKVNKANMAVPWRLEAFQSAMWRFESPTHLPICAHASSLASYIAEQAMLAFGPARDRPRQPWISPATWDVVKAITPVRRRSYRACAAAAKMRMRMAITVWAASCTQAFRAPGRDAHPLPHTNLGWAAVARMQELRRLWLAWSREAAVTWRACAIIQHAIRPCVDADRITYIELKAAEGQAAARRGDWRETFAVVRALSGKSSKRCTQQVRKLDGELTAT